MNRIVKSYKVLKSKKDNGLGGTKVLCQEFGTGKLFIVKPDKAAQWINEYLGQTLIKALGLPHIDVIWCTFNGKNMCATIYEPNLIRMRKEEFKRITSTQRSQFLSLYVVNRALLNDDFLEFFLRKNGEVVTLDFGCALFEDIEIIKAMDKALLNKEYVSDALKNCFSKEKLEFIFRELSKYNMGIRDSVYEDSVVGIWEKMEKLTIEDFKEFIDDLYLFVGEWEGNFYERLIGLFLEAIKEIDRPLKWNSEISD